MTLLSFMLSFVIIYVTILPLCLHLCYHLLPFMLLCYYIVTIIISFDIIYVSTCHCFRYDLLPHVTVITSCVTIISFVTTFVAIVFITYYFYSDNCLLIFSKVYKRDDNLYDLSFGIDICSGNISRCTLDLYVQRAEKN